MQVNKKLSFCEIVESASFSVHFKPLFSIRSYRYSIEEDLSLDILYHQFIMQGPVILTQHKH